MPRPGGDRAQIDSTAPFPAQGFGYRQRRPIRAVGRDRERTSTSRFTRPAGPWYVRAANPEASVNVLSLVIGLSGLLFCWPPHWGWGGVAVALIGCVFSFRGFADARTTPGDLGYNIAGFALGSWGVVWGVAMQIKHNAGGIDLLLLPLPAKTLLIISVAAIALFWIAAFVSRRLARKPLLTLAALALLILFAAGSSTLVLTDRAYDETGDVAAAIERG